MVNARKFAQRYEKKMTYAREKGGLLAIMLSFFCFCAKKEHISALIRSFKRKNIVSVFSRLCFGHRSVGSMVICRFCCKGKQELLSNNSIFGTKLQFFLNCASFLMRILYIFLFFAIIVIFSLFKSFCQRFFLSLNKVLVTLAVYVC